MTGYSLAIVKPGLAQCLQRHHSPELYRHLGAGTRVRVLDEGRVPALIRNHLSVFVVPDANPEAKPVRVCDKFLDFLPAAAGNESEMKAKASGSGNGKRERPDPAGERRIRALPPSKRRRDQHMRGLR